jgi:hypothetical protein
MSAGLRSRLFPLGPPRETKVHWASGIRVTRLKGWKSQTT